MTVEGFKLIKEFPSFDYKIGDIFVQITKYEWGYTQYASCKIKDGSFKLKLLDRIKIEKGEFFEKIKVKISW